jgi:intracellular septation protein
MSSCVSSAGLDGREAMVQATWVLVGASAVALIVGYAVERRLAPLPLLAGGFALIFGVLTLFFHDPSLLKIKLSIQNGLLAAVLLGSLPLGNIRSNICWATRSRSRIWAGAA